MNKINGPDSDRRRRILIIEDETQLVTMLKMRLAPHGFEVLSAGDGEEGVLKAKQEKPDIIILDILMPKMDGYDVCKTIKSDPGVKNIPIVILTASGVIGVEQKCMDCGANGLLRKPYDANKLLAKIEELLGGKNE